MTPTQIIRIALEMAGSMDTVDPKIKAAARKLCEAGEVKIETWSANKVGKRRLIVNEGYTITPDKRPS